MHGDRLQTNVARFIVVVSILGAVTSWRASEWSERAGAYDQQAAQDRITVEQARAAARSAVAQDLRLLGPAGEAYRESSLLQGDAREAQRRGDAQLAAELRVQAHRRYLEGATLTRFGQAGVGFDSEADGGLSYDVDRATRLTERAAPDLEGVRPEVTRALGEEAHDRSVDLVFAATLFVAALFFLTISQLGGARRVLFAGMGGAVTIAAALLFVLA